MELKIYATFEGKLICALKNDMKNLASETLMGSFYPKYKMYELKIYRGVLYHENEE